MESRRVKIAREGIRMNRFSSVFGNWVGIASAFAVTCSIGYNIFQTNQITRLKEINEIFKVKDSLMNDSMNEILMARISEIRDNMSEMSRNQGKVEGMVAASMNIAPEQNQTSAIWHEGYYRGLKQVGEVEESAYIAGYHRATDDMGCPASVRDKMNAEATRKYQLDKQIDAESEQFNMALEEAEKRRKNIENMKKNSQANPNPQEKESKPESKPETKPSSETQTK
jgi:hypothetical protein